MKFLAMHITNQKLSFDIFTVENIQNIFMEHDLNILMIFVIKEKCIILTHKMYCWLLLQIYLCYLWLLLCSIGFVTFDKISIKMYIFYAIYIYLFIYLWPKPNSLRRVALWDASILITTLVSVYKDWWSDAVCFPDHRWPLEGETICVHLFRNCPD